MKFPKTYPLHEIASIIGCEYVGESNFPVQGMNEIHVVENGDIVFVDHPKYYDKALQSAATIILINKNVDLQTNFITDKNEKNAARLEAENQSVDDMDNEFLNGLGC